jgi:hypothetical protein
MQGYNELFKEKLEKLKGKIKQELKLPKKERRKAKLKMFLKEAKSLSKCVKNVPEMKLVCCPVCHTEFKG